MSRQFSVIFLLIVCSCHLSAANKVSAPATKTYDLPVENVYSSLVQVASADYNLKSAVREGHSATFFTGGQFSLVITAICRANGGKGTVVSLSIAQAIGNPQVFGVGKAKDKEAARFWANLDRAIELNSSLSPEPGTPDSSQGAGRSGMATVTIKSNPDGADINLDGKFVGSTPSTLNVRPGEHAIGVDLHGYKVWQRSVSVTEGDNITISAALEQSDSAPKK